MRKVLLILSYLRNTPEVVEKAIQIAKKQKAQLITFFVLDMDFADNIVHKLTDEGWIGANPSEQLYMSLLKEYKLQAETRIDEIEALAKQEQVAFRSLIKSGSVLDETIKVVKKEKPALIVISRRKRSNLSRLIFGSLANTLKKRVDCEVKIIDAE